MSCERSSIKDVAELEELLSKPSDAVVCALHELEGDLLVLGVGGKMGPTLARMAKRAWEMSGAKRRVIGVSRFSSPGLQARLRSWGIETVSCDLLDRGSLANLPDAPNIVYMAGMKFGSTRQESLTWAMNSFLPGLICERFPSSRISAFSTGNVYGLSPVARGGSREDDELMPLGDYAMSCLGRERIFEHFSRVNHTKISILRLNYANELRYGVLVDIARRVQAEEPVSLSMGYLNAIWQGDASAMSLQALSRASDPPFVINITGRELLSVRHVAEEFGQRLRKPVRFAVKESEDALLSNPQKAYEIFGPPTVSVEQMMTWIADWTMRGGETLDKPTHFEERAGRF